MRIDKVNWITAHKCGKPKWHSFSPSLSWKEYFGPWDCVTKCGLENKLPNQNCWAWCHFSQEKLPQYTDTSYLLSTYCGKYAAQFLWATQYSHRSHLADLVHGILAPLVFVVEFLVSRECAADVPQYHRFSRRLLQGETRRQQSQLGSVSWYQQQ